MKTTDVIVVGAGILGCFSARALKKYNLSVDILEENEDVCEGITRANTGIIYTRNAAVSGTLKSSMSDRASRTFDQLCSQLDVPFRRCGYLYISFGPNGDAFLRDKYETARAEGDLSIRNLSPAEALDLEPHLSRSITKAVYDPNVGTIDPWALGIAAYENARLNGARFHLNEKVLRIKKTGDGFIVETTRETYQCGAVLNCAGLHADAVREMVLPPYIRIRPRAADYYVLDPKVSGLVTHIISQQDEDGKGLTLVPTVDGNILAGPTNRHTDTRSASFPTSEPGLERLSAKCREIIPDFPFDMVIRNFGAIRPNTRYGRIVDGVWVPEDKNIPGFPILEEDGLFSLIGIKTPGLTCANELGLYMAEKISHYLGTTGLNPDYDPCRKAIPHPAAMRDEDRAAFIAEHPDYGEIVCRCKKITKGEVLEAIRRGAVSIDGVRRRTGAGMGRCQGGFCRPLIEKLLRQHDSLRSESPSKKAERTGNIPASCAPHYDVLIIGAGAAGMAAALSACERGLSVVLIDRGPSLGGILPQCIHDGFGLGYFKEDLTGTAYAERFIDRIQTAQRTHKLDVLLKTTVLRLKSDRTAVLSREGALLSISFDQCILATGCRERAIGSLGISGTRPEGIYTAGQMQKMVNIDHLDIGRRVAVLGTGDIGQIVARRLAINGKEIVAMIEKEDHIGGMVKNYQRCIKAHRIPVILNSTIVEIRGGKHLESVVVENLKTKERTTLACDTLLTAVGLIPERELVDELLADSSRSSMPEWIHITGNADYVHEIVDSVTTEAEALGRSL
ncbi:MAG: FAD-dependent oxidoreductase [Lachnospiraceae bacterium]|nr:FAD-dependent oxidoreductase [Lachnospiraceae bacterium]